MAVFMHYIYLFILLILNSKATVSPSLTDPAETIARFLNHVNQTPPTAYYFTLSNMISSQNFNNTQQLLQFYVLLFQQIQPLPKFTQKSLVQIMQTMITNNVKLAIDMDVCVWNEFFVCYYKRNMEFTDSYVIKLLTACMSSEGSNIIPNQETFEIILWGITNHPQVAKDKKLILIKYIIDNHMMGQYAQISLILHNQLKFAILAPKYHDLIETFFSNPNSIFPAAKENINLFNEILKYLPSYVEEHGLSLTNSLEFMMNRIMPHHKVVYNMETYTILKVVYVSGKQAT
eukprot:140181_1